jgi:transcriptional regulator with XRE-family HTH domain
LFIDVQAFKRQFMIPKIDASGRSTLRANLQFSCWQRTVDRDKWPSLLAKWLTKGASQDDGELRPLRLIAEGFLLGDVELDHDQVEAVAQSLHRDIQELMFENWPAAQPGRILRENVRRLLGNSGAETKGELASLLGVSAATLSRWTKGHQEPDTRARRAIVSLFGLQSVEELEQTPLFLSYAPVTHAERVAWIQSRVVDMSWHELKELFPALRRLCEPRHSRSLDRDRSEG